MSLYYEDEYVQLHQGDCRAIRGWTEADVLVTDPPYGVDWKQRIGDGRRAKEQAFNHHVVQGDADSSIRDEALAIWGGRPAIIFGSWRVARPSSVRSLLIWNKEGAYSGPLNAAFFTNHEEIYVVGEGWRKSSPPLRSVITTTEHRGSATADVGHPTPKPIGLMERLIDRCPPGLIADPFAGSGATLIAARNLGRKAIGVELEERYCELIVKRLSQQAFDFSALEGGDRSMTERTMTTNHADGSGA